MKEKLTPVFVGESETRSGYVLEWLDKRSRKNPGSTEFRLIRRWIKVLVETGQHPLHPKKLKTGQHEIWEYKTYGRSPRLYFGIEQDCLILLLVASLRKDQNKDLETAIRRLATWKETNHE